MTTRREFIQSLPAAGATFAIARHVVAGEKPPMAAEAAAPQGHFHPKGKAPSKYTLEALRQAKKTLPFGDRRDFDPRFEIMPGTKIRDTQLAHADPYEAVPGPAIAE